LSSVSSRIFEILSNTGTVARRSSAREVRASVATPSRIGKFSLHQQCCFPSHFLTVA
jgi:hypothetical protein